MSAEKKSQNTCLLLAAGCGCGLLLVAALVGGGIFWGVRSMEHFAKSMEDPGAREAKALDILGADQLPPGYRAEFGIEIPFMMRIAILSDDPREDRTVEDQPAEAPPEIEGEPTDEATSGPSLETSRDAEHTLLYLETLAMGDRAIGKEDRQRVDDFFSGVTDDPDALSNIDIHLQIDEVLRRGTVQDGDQELRYVVARGDVQDLHPGGSLMNLVWVRCPGDSRFRLAVWSGPDREPISPDTALDLTGTVGDEAQLVPFLGHFSFCR